jgi:hypothetical protein
MRTQRILAQLKLLVCLYLILTQPLAVRAQSAWFTFHGQLVENGAPANGIYDMEFRLFDTASGGVQQGSTNPFDDLEINNGLFSARLDFGSDVFDGGALA